MARIEPLLNKIRENLTDDLLHPKYRKRKRLTNTAGHCYVATEALYHSLSSKQKEFYKPHYIKVKGQTHWFLMSPKIGNIINILDPTFDQFGVPLKYDKPVKIGFLTKQPSKRAIILLNRIK